jgi:hypothetical protein
MQRGIARYSRVGAWTTVCALALVLCLPAVAQAATVEASAVVTVDGSVSSVTGTVAVLPVSLTSATVSAIGSAVAASVPTPDSSGTVAESDMRVVDFTFSVVVVFFLSLLAGFVVGRL